MVFHYAVFLGEFSCLRSQNTRECYISVLFSQQTSTVLLLPAWPLFLIVCALQWYLDGFLLSALSGLQWGSSYDYYRGFPDWPLAPPAYLVPPNCFCCLPESSETDITLFCLVDTNWVLFLNVILHIIQEKNYVWKLTMTHNFRLQEASCWPTPSWGDKDRQPLLSFSARFVRILQMPLFPWGIVSKWDCGLQSANLGHAESAENDKCWKQCGWDFRSP